MTTTWKTALLLGFVLGLLSVPGLADGIPATDAFSDVLLIKTGAGANAFTAISISQPLVDTKVENPSSIPTLKPAVGITKGVGVALLEPDGSLSDVVFSDGKGNVGLASDPGISLSALEKAFGFTTSKANEISEKGAVITPGVPLSNQIGKFQDVSARFGAKGGTILVASDPNVPEPGTLALFVLGASVAAFCLHRQRRRLPRA
ncbi:MAG: PEP-CTERM sorting domain-containing protein [Terriglobia bacterium]